jgi:hypothetical protein
LEWFRSVPTFGHRHHEQSDLISPGEAIDLAFLMNEDKRDMMGSSELRRFLSAVDVSSQADSLSLRRLD